MGDLIQARKKGADLAGAGNTLDTEGLSVLDRDALEFFQISEELGGGASDAEMNANGTLFQARDEFKRRRDAQGAAGDRVGAQGRRKKKPLTSRSGSLAEDIAQGL